MHDAVEPLARIFPSLAMIVVFVCQKQDLANTHDRISKKKRRSIEKKGKHHGLFSIPTHLTEKERALLFDLANRTQEGAIIVEVGS
jgi:hypothetical protein